MFDPDWELIMETPERLAKLRQMFPMPEEVFDAATKADPTAIVQDGHVVKAGIYTQWLLGLWKKLSKSPNHRALDRYTEDLDKIAEDLALYHKFKAKIDPQALGGKDPKNIFNIPDDAALNELVKGFQKNEPEQQGTGGSVKIYNANGAQVVVPLTYKASCKYGAGTRWCTAMNSTDSHFNSYTRQGPLFIAILRNSPDMTPEQQDWLGREGDAKYQFHFGLHSVQAMDANDRGITVDRFFKAFPELGQAMLKYYSSGGVDFGVEGDFEIDYQIIDQIERSVSRDTWAQKKLESGNLRDVPAEVVFAALRDAKLSPTDPRLSSLAKWYKFYPDAVEITIDPEDLGDMLGSWEKGYFLQYFVAGDGPTDYEVQESPDDLFNELDRLNQEKVRQLGADQEYIVDGEIDWDSEFGARLAQALTDAARWAMESAEYKGWQTAYIQAFERVLGGRLKWEPENQEFEWMTSYEAAERVASQMRDEALPSPLEDFPTEVIKGWFANDDVRVPKNVDTYYSAVEFNKLFKDALADAF